MFSSVTGIELAGGNGDIGEHFTQNLEQVVSASADASQNIPNQGAAQERGTAV